MALTGGRDLWWIEPIQPKEHPKCRQNSQTIQVPTWVWVAFVALLAVLLGIDLVLHRGNHVPTARRTLIESAAWVACGLGFSLVVLVAWGGQAFGEYMSGYVIEKSLSIDNVFVWAIIFSSFAIPRRYQHRVLFWGIFGALALRAVFILAGSALITRFWWMLPVFGVVLIASGVKVVRHRDDEGTHGHDRAVELLGRFIPVRPTLSGQRFLLREHGKLVATPLLAALVVIEVTDVVFAVDSVPAILAVSREPFIVFASNAFAILGLRAMYFLLGDARDRFHYLSHALGAILVFVGIKMALSHWWHLPTAASLGVIVIILAAAIVFSGLKQRADARTHMAIPERDDAERGLHSGVVHGGLDRDGDGKITDADLAAATPAPAWQRLGLRGPAIVLRWFTRNAKRMAVLIVGVAVLLAGFAMLVLPGPGIIVLILGLAILATEFAWAERALDQTSSRASQAMVTLSSSRTGRGGLA